MLSTGYSILVDKYSKITYVCIDRALQTATDATYCWILSVLRIRITLMRMRILLVTLMWTRILIHILPVTLILPFTLMQVQTLKKCSNRLIFHTFWLFICKFMRIRIQLISLMRIPI